MSDPVNGVSLLLMAVAVNQRVAAARGSFIAPVDHQLVNPREKSVELAVVVIRGAHADRSVAQDFEHQRSTGDAGAAQRIEPCLPLSRPAGARAEASPP